MAFDFGYAALYVAAGFAAGSCHLNTNEKNKWIPVIGLVVCVAYVQSSYGFSYAFLTMIEYAIGFAISHIFFKKKDLE